MRILIITSGGDSPGMNSAVRGVVRSTLIKGSKVFVARNGYDGLMKGGDSISEFTWNDVGGILNIGGTILGTARSQEFIQPQGRKKAIYNLITRGINRLIIIGGDGSLTGATKLYNEWEGVINEFLEDIKTEGKEPDWFVEHWKENVEDLKRCKIVGLVGSIDNDMADTSMTIGCDTALTRICSAVDAISTTASSHQREFVVEVMGRNCGWLALQAAVTTGADWLLIPEYPSPSNWRSLMCNAILSGKAMGRRSSIVIIAEGAHDEDLNPISSSDVKEALDRVGCDCRITILGHVQRGGSPSFYDRSMSLLLGDAAVEEALSEHPSEPLIACVDGLYQTKLLKITDCLKKSADVVAYYKQKKFQEAMEMRGNPFVRCYNATMTLMRANPSLNKIPHTCNVGVMHIGACSPGMNATVRALVRLFDDKGYNLYTIFNGVQGFTEDNIQKFGWMNVNGWAPVGGARLGTSRYEDGDVDFEIVQKRIIDYALQAIVIIGGLDGYEFASKLQNLKEKYPVFGTLKIVVVPCSISNNLPATQFSIGSDTALNSIIDAVDKIKQSAMAHRRVFVIEVLGGQCGYLSLLGALATGAEKAYIHEKEFSLITLQSDLDYLHHTFDNKKGMALLMISEKASRVFNTNFLATLFEEKSKRKFDVRVAMLGHLQQGGNPSPIDRIHAVDMAQFCVARLDELLRHGEDHNGVYECVGFLPDGELCATSIEDALAQMDMKHRRPKDQWWLDTFYNLAEKYAKYSETA